MILIDILTNLEYGEEAPYFKLFGVDVSCIYCQYDGIYKKTITISKLKGGYIYFCSLNREEIIILEYKTEKEIGRYKITELKEDPTYFVLRDNFLREDVSISG